MRLGAWRHQPRYDEVSYIQVARDYHRMGGVIEVVRCHLDGLCREDNRFPTFVLLLQAFAHDGPAFFADAKLITLATALLLLAAVGLLAWRSFGPSAGVVSILLLASIRRWAILAAASWPTSSAPSAGGRRARDRAGARPRRRLVAGRRRALVGLAYDRGERHLALLALFTAAVTLHGPRVFATLRPYAALLGFAAVAGFLLAADRDRLRRQPVSQLQLLFALARQLAGDSAAGSVAPLAPHRARLLLASPLGVRARLAHHQRLSARRWWCSLYTAGLGITAGTPSQLTTSVPGAIIRIATGAAVHRAGRARPASIAVAAVTAARSWPSLHVSRVAAPRLFALGGQGVGGVATRFMLPARGPCSSPTLRTRWSPTSGRASARRMRSGWSTLLLGIKLATFAGGLTRNPRRAFDIPPDWAETSTWFAQAPGAGRALRIPLRQLVLDLGPTNTQS